MIPRPSSGLAGCGAIVNVVPPLSASGPSKGSKGTAWLPVRLPLPLKLAGGATPIRSLVAVTDPFKMLKSGLSEGPALLAMTELSIVTEGDPLLILTPPPPVADVDAVFPTMVQSRIVTLPVTLSKLIPPPPAVLAVAFPQIVLFWIVTPLAPTVTEKLIPPPENAVVEVPVFPEIVAFWTRRVPPLSKYTPPVGPVFPEIVEF